MSRSNKTTFQKGKKKTGGRKAGVPNKATRLLKEASLIAAEAIGNEKGGDGLVGFMKWAGKKHTPNFLAFLAHFIPQQVETKQVSHEEVVCRTFAEIRQDLIKGGVRVDIIHPALTDETDEIVETDETDKTDETDDDSGEQQH